MSADQEEGCGQLNALIKGGITADESGDLNGALETLTGAD
jgi:hypothetical protein